MRNPLFLVISIFSLIILFGCSTPEVKEKQKELNSIFEERTINSEQPIPIGEIIFKDYFHALPTPDIWGVEQSITYTYLGVDDKNNVKVLYEYEYRQYGHRVVAGKQPKVETLSLLLPLNDKKQTMLNVKGRRGFKRDLLITVVDEFNRITVEEIGKTQMK